MTKTQKGAAPHGTTPKRQEYYSTQCDSEQQEAIVEAIIMVIVLGAIALALVGESGGL